MIEDGEDYFGEGNGIRLLPLSCISEVRYPTLENIEGIESSTMSQ